MKREYYRGQAPPKARVSWYHLCQRCTNPKDKSYKYYGGKGVQVEWANFREFWADMGPTYKPGLEIDRLDSNGNYSKSNCKWSTRVEQMSNTSKNRVVAYKGKTMTLKQWANELQINYHTLHSRITKYGLSFEQAINYKRTYA